jgi:predicted acetyltransferase
VSCECRLVIREDYPALSRMLELYQYELSDICDQELDSQGEFGYDTSKHLQGQGFFAHVLLVDRHYAGFALVAPAMVTRREGFWMEQFFVLKKYRRAGNGLALARYVLQCHPGAWEVGQMTANRAARHFWRTVIADVTHGDFVDIEVSDGWWQGTVQQFTVEPRSSSVRDYVQNRLLSKAGWSWYEVECRCRPKPFCRGPHHDREEA